MKLTVWTYEGPPHVGAMRIATAMKGVHYVLHAPQGDTYADLLFTMIERRDRRPPVTYTTFQARDLGADTAELFKTAAKDAYDRFRPQAMIVGSSCTAELIQDDPGGLTRALGLPIPVIPLDLPSYQKKENWGAAETFYQIVRAMVGDATPRLARAEGTAPRCNILGPTALGFRHRDDLVEIKRLLESMGVAINVVAPLGATPEDLKRLPDADFNVVLYPEIAEVTAKWLERDFGQPAVRTIPMGVGGTRDFIAEVAKVAGLDVQPAPAGDEGRLPWWSRSVDSNYLTNKRVFIFGDASHAVAAARVASEELGFEVVGLGCYNREFAREVRAAAEKYGLTALVTDDYLEVERAIAELQPELVLGTQMERHIAKRLRISCAVISAPAHVQDYPARYSPQFGFEGANVLFDTWVHPLVMGLEEHLLAMFRDDFEFNDDAGPSHLGHASAAPPQPAVAAAPPATASEIVWTHEAQSELTKIPFFVRGKARRNTEQFAASQGLALIHVETLYDARSHFARRPAPAPAARAGAPGTPVRMVVVTLDRHLSGVFARAASDLARDIPGLRIDLHAATEWGENRDALAACLADIAKGDIILVTMLFMDDQIRAVLPALQARREACDAMIGVLSASEIVRLTKLGPFRIDGSDKGPLSILKRLRGSKTKSSGVGQMAMLRRLPKILRFIPGAAQDLRAYFLTMQYWLSGSRENVAAMVRFLIGRYADGPRRALRGALDAAAPRDYPEVGLYHPKAAGKIVETLDALPKPCAAPKGVVGVLILRSYVLADDAGHYDGVIEALEARGLKAVPAFASGLDGRPAIERYFLKDGRPTVDAVVSLAGFSLVGGPAYNDASAAEDMLARLGVPYVSAQPLEFQTLEAWGASSAGLSPVESTIMVAIPELDGAIAPMVFGGRSDGSGEACQGCANRCRFEVSAEAPRMRACPERAATLAARVARLVALRKAPREQRKSAIVLFNFPPNSGAVGSAAYLAVFASLHNTLKALAGAGYDVAVPPTVEALRQRLVEGNADRFGTDANVHHRIPVDDHLRRERHLAEIEGQWGPAPGRALSDGNSIFVLGAQFGNVFVGLQPGFGYEGDPMRLLFERGFAPTHAFSAFYRYLREDFAADAVLHFGTHGALEFMPGKQVGLTADCWPDRLIGDLPNFYLYAANNPSEGALAKRRSGATLISYLTPPVSQAGLYKGLLDLKATIQRWRSRSLEAVEERASLEALIREQAGTLDLAGAGGDIGAIADQVVELEQTLIPSGLHTVGEAASPEERIDLLAAMAEARGGPVPAREAITALVEGAAPRTASALSGLTSSAATLEMLEALAAADRLLARDHELDAIVHALDGGYVRPAPGGDLLRTPAILPTGRNLHGFDPFHIPSAFAVRDGAHQAQIILDRHHAETGAFPESIALVLWGSDNLKSEGAPIAQAMTLIGARPRFDSYGRLCGAQLIPLEDLGRPRVDVLMTLSGIFRDLLALQVRMLADAAFLAAGADEPVEMNFVRKHALELQASHGCDLETAALRVFSNADGAYGANVNQLIDAGAWNDEEELADAYQARKCFAYGRTGNAVRQPAMLKEILSHVDLAYQNVESVELGVTTIDHYADTLGGISLAVRRAKGVDAPVYIGDQTLGNAKVRTLAEQVALETRTRMLNPKWYEGLLKHGYEGVRQIEAQVTNTMGWSATTGQVAPWVYQRISETYVLDPSMRERLADLNPVASSRIARRLLEACDRKLWTPDDATLRALRHATDELEDRLEGVPHAA